MSQKEQGGKGGLSARKGGEAPASISERINAAAQGATMADAVVSAEIESIGGIFSFVEEERIKRSSEYEDALERLFQRILETSPLAAFMPGAVDVKAITGT